MSLYWLSLYVISTISSAALSTNNSGQTSHSRVKSYHTDILNLSSLAFIQEDSDNSQLLLALVSNSFVEISTVVEETVYTLLDLDAGLGHLAKSARPTSFHQLQNGDILIVDQGLKCVRLLQRRNPTITTHSGLCNNAKVDKPVFDFGKTSQNGKDGYLLEARYISPKDIGAFAGNFTHLLIIDHKTLRRVDMINGRITTVIDEFTGYNRLSILDQTIAISSSDELRSYSVENFTKKSTLKFDCKVVPCRPKLSSFKPTNGFWIKNTEQINSFTMSGYYGFKGLVQLSARFILAVRTACNAFMCDHKSRLALQTLAVIDTKFETINKFCSANIDWPPNSFCSEKYLEPLFVTRHNENLLVTVRSPEQNRIMIYTVRIYDNCDESPSKYQHNGNNMMSESHGDLAIIYTCHLGLDTLRLKWQHDEGVIQNGQANTAQTLEPILPRNGYIGDAPTTQARKPTRFSVLLTKYAEARNKTTRFTPITDTDQQQKSAGISPLLVNRHQSEKKPGSKPVALYIALAVLLTLVIGGAIAYTSYRAKSGHRQLTICNNRGCQTEPVDSPNEHVIANPVEMTPQTDNLYDEIEDEIYEVIDDYPDEQQEASTYTETADQQEELFASNVWGDIIYVDHPVHIENFHLNQELA